MLGGIIFLLLIFFIIYVNKNYATIKGNYGERQVNRLLSQLDPALYKIYHDLYIPTEDNRTTQVDHVVTSPYGIFVIETKHYQGWIFGNEKSKYWTQVIYKRKERLFNPIWQNAGHIKALESYLDIEKDHFTSIIAFSTQSTFKFKEDFTRAKVIQFPKLNQTILERDMQVIDYQELHKINQELDKLIITDKEDRKEINLKHVHAIKLERQKEKIPYYDKTKCPKCHSNLIKRNGKYGSFMGCSGFPKCRYTKKIG